MTGFIYKWTNAINGKWYIGSHKGTPDDGYRHSSTPLRFAEKKHGIENFTREILFEGDYQIDKIKTKEAEYLCENNAATNPMSYNRSNITGPNNVIIDENARKKMSAAKKGKTYEEIYGRETAEKLKKQRSVQSKGITRGPHTQERRQNISKGRKGIYSHGAKPTCIDGVTYPSRMGAARALGVDRTTITNWLRNGKAR